MKAFDFYIETKEDIIRAVDEFGFVPLFKNSIQGFSIEEHVSPMAWFDSGIDGVWEWKGPVIRESGCAYGKFFENKAVFVSRDWFLDLANYRRDGYDYDSRVDEGLTPYREEELYFLLDKNAPVLSKKLKAKGGYGKNGKKGFDTIITHLQVQCYVIISDFVYETDRNGKPYGWGVAEYSTPEKLFGDGFRKHVYDRKPEESFERMFEHLKSILPGTSDESIRRMLK